MITKILAGVALAMGIALAGTGWWLSNVIESRAVLRATHQTNLDTIARMESDVLINEAKAIADAINRRDQERDSDERNRAIDAVVENGCGDPAFDALLERRRLQRERDRAKTGRP